ncbi:hypothetical protein DPSP01_012599 [Paraphaeosphaeria sporulosa]
MIRCAFNTTGARMRSLHITSGHSFTTGLDLNGKARVSQLLEQAQSAGPKMYKTVKEKDFDNNAVRRDQLIWLVKHSLGKERVGKKTSLYELPWCTNNVGKQEKKELTQVGVTVWPHLWLVSMIGANDED